MNSYKVVVGIDFGSSGTGYAYSYNNKKDIVLGKFPGQGIDAKVPTQIILDSSFEKILAFGEDCLTYINDNRLINNELFFQKIKMNLYEHKNIIYPQNNSKSYPLVDVIAKVLEYIKNQAYNTIHDSQIKITLNEIKWVVTVPAIWDLSQKGIMIQASEKAGLFNENTNGLNFLALEPEAASLYCVEDESIDPDYIKPGKSYIICDLGGGTGDIVTHKKDSSGGINEEYQPIGGPYGSDEIDKKIYKEVIFKLFGFEDYNSLKEKNNIKKVYNEDELYYEWISLQKEIQKKKKITEKSKNKSFFINFQIFEDLAEDSLEKLLKKYNNSCKKGWEANIKNKSKWILSFEYKIFFDLIEEHASKISNQISEIYERVEEIESILYVGGYSSNEILFKRIKNEFRELVHLKPSRPEISVVKGAVLFGLNPQIIKVRKSPYTLGFNCDIIWDDKIFGGIGQKYYDQEDNVFRCLNSFYTFIKKGENISSKTKIIKDFTTKHSSFIYLKFFKTQKSNPILYTEDGIELMGEDTLNLGGNFPLNERSFYIIIDFGGTYIDATCVHCKSQKTKKLHLYFNKNTH